MKKILVAEDSKTICGIIREILVQDYEIKMVHTGVQVLEALETEIPDLILLDIEMPQINGIEVMKKIKTKKEWMHIPVVFLTADTDFSTEELCLNLGANEFIKKPIFGPVMKKRISNILECEALKGYLQKIIKTKTEQLEEMSFQALRAISTLFDEKDQQTKGHSNRVAIFSVKIARYIKLSEYERKRLFYAALIHDIGKVGFSGNGEEAEGKSSSDSYGAMHSEMGASLISGITKMKDVANAVRYHHKNYDGSGYPQQLKGTEIPITARIIALADGYAHLLEDCRNDERPVNEQLILALEKESGKKYDPELVKALIDIIKQNEFDSSRASSEVINEYERNMEVESIILLQKVLSEYTKKMESDANKDALTNLWNRAYLEGEVNRFLLTNDAQGSLFMIDLDNFKSANDTYGHAIGDEILTAVGNVLTSETDQGVIASRIGGDEFSVFFQNITNHELLQHKAETIIQAVEEEMYKIDKRRLLSVSLGIAVSPKDGEYFRVLYEHADKALYHVKNNGKASYYFYDNALTNESTVV